MGMDLIHRIVSEIECKRFRCSKIDSRLKEKLSIIKSQLQVMDLQSRFMTLSINRCLDYTKISNETNLTCEAETVDIRVALEQARLFAPLVLGGMSADISVSIGPLPSSLCPFFITDPRWLLENILCLIEQSQHCLFSESFPEGSKSLTIRVSIEEDPSGRSEVSSPIVAYRPTQIAGVSLNKTHRLMIPVNQQFQLKPQRPTEVNPVSSERITRRVSGSKVAASLRHIAAQDEVDPLISLHEGGDLCKESQRFPFKVSPAIIGPPRHASPSPGFQIRVEVMLPVVESTTASDRLSCNGNSQTIMNFMNFQERLHTLKGTHGKVETESSTSWFFSVPFRPDIARHDVRASFFGSTFTSSTATSSLTSYSPHWAAGPPSSTLSSCYAYSSAKSDSSTTTLVSASAFTASPQLPPSLSFISASANDSTDHLDSRNFTSADSTPVSPRFIDVVYNSHYMTATPGTVKLGTGSITPRASSDELMEKNLVSIVSSTQIMRRVVSLSTTPRKEEGSSTVVLVDDSALVLKLTRSVLERSGYLVQVAHNGLEAVQLIDDIMTHAYLERREFKVLHQGISADDISDRKEPNMMTLPIVLMDLQMPVLDGIEAVRRIRTREAELQQMETVSELPFPHLVVLALSANNHDSIVQEALEVGCDAFLQKPFNLEDFQEVIEQIRVLRKSVSGSFSSSSV